MIQEKINELKQEILKKLSETKDLKMLEEIEIKYLGRKGEFTQILRNLVNLSEADRREIGSLANEIKRELQEKFEQVKKIISGQENANQFIDVTLPGKKIERGHLHPMSQIQYEIEDLFSSMGFMVLDGPELESDYYNFEALNIPRHHPARDMQDTFYIDQKNKDGEYDMVMRTQTSPVQVRAMEKYGAPLKCIIPGRTFRCEALDACHEHTFSQVEGLMVDKNISIANMIAVMKELINGIFKREVETRIRPGYFPFVEPGIELDIKCTICNGSGCPSCKNSGWLELLPAGMVHPNVLRYGGIDPDQYTGFAFGLGFSRLVMMKYGIADIRNFNGGDMRFLEQF